MTLTEISRQMDTPNQLVRLKRTGEIGVDYGEVRVDLRGIRNIPMRRIVLIDFNGQLTNKTITAFSSHIEPIQDRLLERALERARAARLSYLGCYGQPNLPLLPTPRTSSAHFRQR